MQIWRLVAKGKSPSQKAPLVGFQEVLRDICFSEVLKIQSDRCKSNLVTIDGLCAKENNDFCAVYKHAVGILSMVQVNTRRNTREDEDGDR